VHPRASLGDAYGRSSLLWERRIAMYGGVNSKDVNTDSPGQQAVQCGSELRVGLELQKSDASVTARDGLPLELEHFLDSYYAPLFD
jgi:hypothetical protein